MYAFTILGLPAHPLIVHGAVVGIPLAALGTLAYAARPTLRPRLWWPLLVTVVLAWLCTFLAGSTGETLEHALKHSHFIEQHAMWADRLGLAVHVLAATTVITLVSDGWCRLRTGTPPVALVRLRTLTLPLSVLAAVASLVLVGVVGHLGAKAAWHDSPAASAKVCAER
ncbi:MAG: hypothetical protein JWN72_1668 [Thermoleophilia bacterium]|nr:hypothetical protein [Thermoleophilia bacterium]